MRCSPPPLKVGSAVSPSTPVIAERKFKKLDLSAPGRNLRVCSPSNRTEEIPRSELLSGASASAPDPQMVHLGFQVAGFRRELLPPHPKQTVNYNVLEWSTTSPASIQSKPSSSELKASTYTVREIR